MSAPQATKKAARSASKKITPSKEAPKAKRGDGQRVSNISKDDLPKSKDK